MARFRAAVLKEFGKPFSLEEVEIQPPEGWVRVKVKAVGVCGRDGVVWKGGFRNLKPPLILGHEIFGEYKGRPVAVFPAVVGEECLRPGMPENLCRDYRILGETLPGGYAEEVYVPEWNLIPLRDRVYEKYAAAACGVATAIHALKQAGVGPGDKVLVTGAGGGVGIHMVQYYAKLGLQVYAQTRSEWKAKILEELGATPVVGRDFSRQAGKVDAVFEIVGAPTINESMRALKPRGTLVLVGNVTGEPVTITRPALLVMREVRITGTAAYTRSEYEAAIRIIEQGLVRPIYKAYKLEDVNQAYRDIAEGKVLGRAVLVVGEPRMEPT